MATLNPGNSNPLLQGLEILIVGAGMGGLVLAAILERGGISYRILEQATALRPLGSALTLGANVLPVFEQLGLLPELEAMSLPCPSLDIYTADMNKFGALKLTGRKATGYENLIFERPRLFNLLLKQVPSEKILLGKRVTGFRDDQETGRVVVQCADNIEYDAHILVGADGAYSAIRRNLYDRLKDRGGVPKEDLEDLVVGDICMVGVSTPSHPENYPQLKDHYTHFSCVLGGNNQSWNAISVADNKICWSLIVQLTEEEAKTKKFQNSEWGPLQNEEMILKFQDKPCPWGGTMGDIIKDTPNELISRVFLEEKIFKTWFDGRTVLLGDSCHKMLPGAGQGAVNAIQDAVVLANCIYNMQGKDQKNITSAFEEYYRQRFHNAEHKLQTSKIWSMVMFGQTWTERLVRQLMVKYLPEWVFDWTSEKNFAHRPQIAWLSLVENRGTMTVNPQEGKRHNE